MKEKTIEDYLRAIYFLIEKKSGQEVGVSSVDLAKELGISKASVSEMISKLKNIGLVDSEPYSKVYLTKKGLEKAKKVMHKHRLIEYFLSEVLKCDMRKIHTEAHNLEHAFSEETIKKLDDFLDNPNTTPHGKEIPH